MHQFIYDFDILKQKNYPPLNKRGKNKNACIMTTWEKIRQVSEQMIKFHYKKVNVGCINNKSHKTQKNNKMKQWQNNRYVSKL